MTEKNEDPQAEDARMPAFIRRLGIALLPLLIIAQGAAAIGESMAEQASMRSGVLASGAKALHDMAALQEAVYQSAPGATAAAIAAAAATSPAQPAVADLPGVMTPVAGEAGTSAAAAPATTDKAIEILQQAKAEQSQQMSRNARQSEIESVRSQWFHIAKSALMLALGLTAMGVFLRSRGLLYSASAAGLVGVALTVNTFVPRVAL